MPAIFHFTDIGNVESILDSGALKCHRDATTVVDVGNRSIKGNRSTIEVDCGMGGKVCDYVPFYFAPCSPMLSSIIHGNVEGVSPDQRRLVYFVELHGGGLSSRPRLRVHRWQRRREPHGVR